MTNKPEVKLIAREIEDLRQRQLGMQEKMEAERRLLAESIGKRRALILSGEATTGDRISDFFFGAYGILNDGEVSTTLRDLEAQMVGKVGQFFLVVRSEKEEYGPVFRGGPSSFCGPSFHPRFHFRSRCYLGILADEKLVLDPKGRTYGIPTEVYAEVWMSAKPVKVPGPFLFVGTELLKFPGSPGESHGMFPELYRPDPVPEIFVGCDAVFKYSPPELHAKAGTRPSRWVRGLYPAIRLLGRNIPEAPEEKAAREEEEKKFLNLLDEKRHEYKRLLAQRLRYVGELEKCGEQLRQMLDRAKEMGLEGRPEVQLVVELGIVS